METKPIYKVPVPLEVFLWRAGFVLLTMYFIFGGYDYYFYVVTGLIAIASFRQSPDCRVEVFDDHIKLTYPGIQEKVDRFYYDRISGYEFTPSEVGFTFLATESGLRLFIRHSGASARSKGARMGFDYVKDDGTQKLIIRDFAISQNAGILKVNELIKGKIRK